MKNWIVSATWLLALGALAFLPMIVKAANSPEDQKTIDTLIKTYPLDTCPVSGAKLGQMGAPIDYLYKTKVDGKDSVRLVRFCCPACPAKFNADPQKYLSIIDAAAKNHAPVVSAAATPSSGCSMGAGCSM